MDENTGAGANGGTEDKTKGQPQEKPQHFTAEDVEKKIAEATAGLKAKVEELLGETKAEREKRQEMERAAEQAETERKRKAGEFQGLYEKTLKDLEEERAAKEQLKTAMIQKEIKNAASALATEWTRDAAKAAVLADYIAKHVKTDADGNVTGYEFGGIDIDKAKLAEHFRQQYPFLMDGSQANGGGASGGNGGAATPQRSKMTPAEKNAYIREHGQAAYLKLPK